MRRRAGTVVAAVVLLAVVVLGSGSGVGPVGTADPKGFDIHFPTRPAASAPSMPPATPSGLSLPTGFDGPPVPGWVWASAATVIGAVLVFGAVVLVLRVLQALDRRTREAARAANATGVVIEEIPVVEVEEAFETSLADLRSGGDVDDAVVECWRRLQNLGDRLGHPRRPADTSSEYVSTLLGSTPADPADLAQLAQLYRTAMFSTHAADPGARDEAIACLERLTTTLRTAAATAAPATATAAPAGTASPSDRPVGADHDA